MKIKTKKNLFYIQYYLFFNINININII